MKYDKTVTIGDWLVYHDPEEDNKIGLILNEKMNTTAEPKCKNCMQKFKLVGEKMVCQPCNRTLEVGIKK